MNKQATTSPVATSPVQTQSTNQGAENMKKIITTAATFAVIAISTLVINPSVAQAQSPKSHQVINNSFDFQTAQGTDDWDGGLIAQGTDDWDGGLMKVAKGNTWYF